LPDSRDDQPAISATIFGAGRTSPTPKAATWGARRLWRDGYRYSKAGVMTFDLVKLAASQRALFDGFDRKRSAALMGEREMTGFERR
jgi:hypothetical protein